MKKAMNILLSWVLAITFSSSLYAQGEANVWYFGNGAGLNFSTIPPGILQDGNAGLMTFTGEGVGSISDASGNLLFYTNGNIVYNRNHVAMANGGGLNGNGTTTQTGTIVPKPGSTTEYYIFTPRDGDGAATYSIVDMSLNAGLGDVTASKNVALLANSSESCLVIGHDNGVDYWVIFHASTTGTFSVFLLNAAGITGPTNYAVGGSGQATMIMKVNSCLNKIASAFYNQGRVEIVDFNNVTGVVSNTGMITLSGVGAFNDVKVYGVEFSPNGRYLYVSESGLDNLDDVHQFDLQAGSNAAIIATRKTHVGGTTVRAGALQLGPDGKIYVPGYTTTVPGYLSVIPTPNVGWTTSPPTATEFEYLKHTFYLKRVGEGLPPILKNLLTSMHIISNNACEGGTTNFSFQFGSAVNAAAGSIAWNYGDGSPVVYDQLTPSHTYATAGTYTVTLTVLDICNKTRTATTNVIVKTGPTYSTPVTICQNQNVVITGTGGNAANYTWSTDPSGSPVLQTGSSYTYNGTLPATVYVQDATPLATYVTGNSSVAAHAAANTGYTYFDVYTKLKLTSFSILSRNNGTATVSIRDAATATTIFWSSDVSPTASGELFVLTPNITLNPGSYVFYVTPDDLLFFKHNTNLTGNRDVNGVISISGERNLARGGMFYNINVAVPDPCGIRAINLVENCPLPVSVVDFYGIMENQHAYLYWVTTNEISNGFYLVQRSTDGTTFETIGLVNGAKTARVTREYTFNDPEPLEFKTYYRLVHYNPDGTYEYSRNISLDNGNMGVVVYPDPFESELMVQLPYAESVLVELLDLSGRMVFQDTKNSGGLYKINGELISSGTYILRVYLPDQVYVSKVVRN